MKILFDKKRNPRTLMITGAALPMITRYGEEPSPMLHPISLRGREAMGEPFRYVVRMRTDISQVHIGDEDMLNLDSIVGTEVTLHIDIPGKGEFIPGMSGDTGTGNIGAYIREISGRVEKAQYVAHDGRALVYEFVVVPALHQAELTSQYRLFQDNDVIQILKDILDRYPISIDWRIAGPIARLQGYPKRDLQRQYFESDWNFALRLCEEWGLFFWYEHSGTFHRLVVADTLGAFRAHGPAYETLRYSGAGGARIDEEHIHELTFASSMTAGKVTVVDHDYMNPRMGPAVTPLREGYEDPRKTGQAKAEVYVYGDVSQPLAGAMGLSGRPNDPREEASFLATVRLQSLRCEGLRVRGKGNMRGLLAGHTFHLIEHPYKQANREYVVISAELTMEEISQSSGTGQEFRCETVFEALPVKEYFRLPIVTPKPRQTGLEWAIVTGPEGHEIWTDALGRVRIQFVPDREAKLDQDSSIWIQPAKPWQGSNMGATFTPRVGTQVLVACINGDPDLPVIVNAVVNKSNMPAWLLPFNQWVSGFRSQNEDGRSASTLGFVDTKGEQQAHLSSDHGTSQLSLGFIRRLLGNEGLKDARGQGYELRTDFWGTLRAAMGIYITAHGRANAEGKVKDADETITRLMQARDMHEGMVGLAQQHGAQMPDTDQSDVMRSIKQQTADIRGTAKGGPNDFPEFSSPIIALSSPAGIGTSTAGSTHIQSDKDTAITTGRSIGIAAGKSFHAAVLERISLFVRKAGMLLVAASGKIRIEAQSDGIDVAAKKDVQITSEDGWINLTAMKGIRLNGAGTTVELSAAGFLGATNGLFQVHASDHKTDGPQSTPPVFPPRTYADKSSLSHLYHDGEPVQGAKFDIHYDDGKRYSGTLDSAGHADLSGAPVGASRMEIGPDSRPLQVKANDPNPDYKSRWGESDFRASANKQDDGGV